MGIKSVCSLFQLLESEQQVAQLQATVKELEATLETTRSQLQDKDAQLEDQKRRERDLLTTITEYKTHHPFCWHLSSLPSLCAKVHKCSCITSVFCCYLPLHQHAAARAAGPGGWSQTSLFGF